MVAQVLDRLHDQFPGCETIGFADLASRMMLVTSSGSTVRREDLDALCAEAALVFGPPDTPALGDLPASTIFIARPDHLRIYLRDLRDPDDALCCICDTNLPVESFVRDARASLQMISHGA